MKNKVLNYIRENRMIDEGQTIVVGVSGGADSMCLLDILLALKDELGISVAVVHIHHGIRGESADKDARFVEEYCRGKEVTCFVKRYDVPKLSSQWGMSHEEAGRRVRYEAFNEVIESLGAVDTGKIAVAHNADDHAETVLLNLCRGTGLKGLLGIRPMRDNIIRPVLCLSRWEIETYNKENGILYVQDETNLTEEYTRNKIRLGIMPKIKEINDRALEHINVATDGLSLIDDYMEKEASRIYEKLVEAHEEGHKLTIDVSSFLELHKAMQIELVKKCLYKVAGKAKDITKQHIDSVLGLFEMTVGKQVSLPYDMVAVRQYEKLSITKNIGVNLEGPDDTCVHITGEGVYDVELSSQDMRITVQKDTFCSEIFEENQYTKWIDCDIMKCDLQVRTRRNGDYIALDTNGSRKKLKDFFIDKKIPKEERDRIVLIANGSEIVWVVGYRLSGAYKVSEASEHITKLQIDYQR